MAVHKPEEKREASAANEDRVVSGGKIESGENF